MGHNDIRDKMKNPLIDVDEDISVKPFQRLQFFEKVGLASALIISVLILVLASFSFYIDILVEFRFFYAMIDLFVIIMCLGILYFIINTLKRKMVTDILIDKAVQEGIYERLRPLIENIAQAQTGNNIIQDQISSLDLKLQDIQKELYRREIKSDDLMKEPLAVGTSIKFAIKAVFLIIITMAGFIYMVNFQLGGITPYSVLLFHIMWWGFITSEYKLWKESFAWAMAFLPILIIPVMFLVLANLLDYNVTMATFYLFVGLYAFGYYLWAVYASTGSLPIMITRKREPVAGEFFALQQKGILREYIDEAVSRIEQQLQNDKKDGKPTYIWKK